MTAPALLAEVSYMTVVHGVNRLLYNEVGAKIITELTRPAHRVSLAQGNWRPDKSPLERQLEMIQTVSGMGEPSKQGEFMQAKQVPALSAEEFHCAQALLQLFDYAAGRGVDLGRAAMLVHMWQAAQPKR